MTRASPTTLSRPPSTPGPASPTLPEDPAPPIAREGWPIVAGFVVGAILLTGGGYWLLGTPGAVAVGAVCAALCLWCLWFFRDPARRTPADESAVIAPADGVVVMVTPAPPPPELNAEGLAAQMPRICIFMNVFNVHVNRSPVSGTVVGAHYTPGKFFNASLDKASEHNERSSLAIRTGAGQVLAVVQIAGLIARRIVSKVKVGDTRRAGQRYGLIRFGSRVDVYVPAGSEVLAKVGQVTVAGETVIARLAGAR